MKEIWKDIQGYSYIYLLLDPRDRKIRYVGKADNPQLRFNRHIKDMATTHKTCWIKQLKKINLLPIMQIIDSVPKDNWQYWEKYYIAYYKSIGCELVNIADGGLGGGNTFWKGKKREKKDCEKISNSLRGRKLSKQHKAKMREAKNHLRRTQQTFNKIGEKNSKLTQTQVLHIRQVFANIKWGEKAKFESLLAQKYNVTSRTIRGVVKKEVWKHIEKPIISIGGL